MKLDMKLELKHLSPYLPYDLKCDIFFAQQSMVRTLDCFYLDKLKTIWSLFSQYFCLFLTLQKKSK